MADETKATDPAAGRSEVAMWHALSGLPDNVTDEGLVVRREQGRELSAEKAGLRAAIARLRTSDNPDQARTLARLAAGYLLAGDVETARRYIARAETIVWEETARRLETAATAAKSPTGD